jgi:ribonuclease HI/transposase InsO family protein
VTVVSSFPLG